MRWCVALIAAVLAFYAQARDEPVPDVALDAPQDGEPVAGRGVSNDPGRHTPGAVECGGKKLDWFNTGLPAWMTAGQCVQYGS